jgi:radical SAM superfamily enzyme YgiQ (UPF0313 family)
MRVTFVSLGHQEYLGVEYLSAYLKREGHETNLVHNPALFDDRFQLYFPRLAKPFDQDKWIIDKILELEPDLIGFSVLTNTYKWALNIAAQVRKIHSIPTIFGNIHPSSVPQHVITRDEVDFVCEGEGEMALLRLVDTLEGGKDPSKIPNIWSKKSNGEIVPPPYVEKFIQDLDNMPFPDKELYKDTFRTQDIYNLMTGRGCPYRCTFCFNNQFANLPTNGKAKEYVRRRSVENVLEELHMGKQKYNFQNVFFYDDIFTMNKPWLKEFLPRFKEEIGVPWACETHAKFMDDEIAQLMKDTGCAYAQMGIQSLDEFSYKHNILKRNEKTQDVVKTFNAFGKAKLHLYCDHIFGLPDESVEAQEQALEFYREYTPDRVSCFWLTYFPGLEITKYAYDQGYLNDEHMERINGGELQLYHEIHTNTPEDEANLKTNMGYMIAFHLMPSVPKFLRKYVIPKLLVKIPSMVFISKIIVFTSMVMDFWRTGNFTGVNYLRHYLYHIFGAGRNVNCPLNKSQYIGSKEEDSKIVNEEIALPKSETVNQSEMI